MSLFNEYIVKDKNNNKHFLYEGDNLDVLEYLDCKKEKYDMIYIDPVYNAKNKTYKNYNDNVKNWLSFMKQRLLVSKNILNDDGLIFISIGEDSVCELKLLCDEIFGVENKLAMFSVKTPNQTEGRYIIKNTDYILAYRKTSFGTFHYNTKIQEARCTTSKPSQIIYSIKIPEGVRVVKIPDGIYENTRKVGGNEDLELLNGPAIIKDGKTANSFILKGRWSCPNDVNAYLKKFKEQANEPVYNKYGKELVDFYLYDTKFQPRLVKNGFKKPETFLDDFLSKGRNELKSIIGPNSFSYPKHSSLIKFIIGLGVNNPNAKILDFFGGSGTTFQAVIDLNEENNSNMSCTLITNNENNIFKDITVKRIENIL